MKKVIRKLLEVLIYFLIVLLVISVFSKLGWITGNIWSLALGSTIGFILYQIIIILLKK